MFIIDFQNIIFIFSDLCLQKRPSHDGYQWRTFLNSQSAKRVLKNLPNLKLLYQYNGLMYFERIGISEVQRVCTTWNFHHLALHTPYVLKAMPTQMPGCKYGDECQCVDEVDDSYIGHSFKSITRVGKSGASIRFG